MNICLIGYGKMGKEIENVAKERGHAISLIIDLNNPQDLNPQKLADTDVAIEFTNPEAASSNIRKCFEANVPVVTGTTGWYEQLDEIKTECRQKQQALFYASNFSIGVNLFFAVNEYLAGLMNSFPQYDISIQETHHTQKLDAPSGTAISLAEIILKAVERKTNWKLDPAPSPEEISVEAKREGDVKGFHEVKYESEIDVIRFSHFAKTRKGFAQGAVMAAEYLQDRKGVFTMNDLLGL